MTCPCCSRPRPPDLPIVGIQYGLDDAPALILWNCPCGTTRAVKWRDATEPMRAVARLAELSRDALSEMHCWRER